MLLAATLAGAAPAAEFSGSTTTIVRYFDLKHDLTGLDSVVPYRPVDQLVQLDWVDVGRRGGWSVSATVRGRLDLDGDGRGAEDELQVLLARARWRSSSQRVTVTLGRQRSVTGLGWRAWDGARVDVRASPRVRTFAQVGLPVDLGDNGSTSLDDLTWGLGAAITGRRHWRVGFDHLVRRFAGGSVEETTGVDFQVRRGGFALVANADYSRPHDRFGETEIVVTQRVHGRHFVEARWTRVQPVLPTDSIFAVFVANPFTERSVSWEWRGTGGLSMGARVTHEDYTDTKLPGPQDIERAVVTFRWDDRRGGMQRGELGWQRGFSGRRLAARWDGDWKVGQGWRLGCGASLNRYENVYRLNEQDEEIALRGRAARDWGHRCDVALNLEQYFGRDRDTLHGSLVVRVKLGKMRESRPWWAGPVREGWRPHGRPSDAVPARSEPDGAAQ